MLAPQSLRWAIEEPSYCVWIHIRLKSNYRYLHKNELTEGDIE